MSNIKLEGLVKAYGDNAPVIKNLDLEIEDGSFTVLLGASGCGKSTILRMVAGLENETSGKIYIGGKDMTDVEPGDRNIAMVFQNYAIYPTMTVKQNIEFGLKNMKVPTEERKKRIIEVAKTVGLSEYLDRKPQHLSGGQRQRVALARAIVKEPKVFLMDEPLSNLDAKLRTQIRADLIELYRKLQTTFLYVTHDQIEAMSMGTKIILLKDGVIQQMGTPTEIYNKPANIYTAKFIGSPPMNILNANYIYKSKDGDHLHISYIGFRPESVKLNKTEETALTFEGEILARELLGDQTLYKVRLSGNYKNNNDEDEVIIIKTFHQEPLEYGDVKFYVDKKDICYFDTQENRVDIMEETLYEQ